jgi:hypothetical protein
MNGTIRNVGYGVLLVIATFCLPLVASAQNLTLTLTDSGNNPVGNAICASQGLNITAAIDFSGTVQTDVYIDGSPVTSSGNPPDGNGNSWSGGTFFLSVGVHTVTAVFTAIGGPYPITQNILVIPDGGLAIAFEDFPYRTLAAGANSWSAETEIVCVTTATEPCDPTYSVSSIASFSWGFTYSSSSGSGNLNPTGGTITTSDPDHCSAAAIMQVNDGSGVLVDMRCMYLNESSCEACSGGNLNVTQTVTCNRAGVNGCVGTFCDGEAPCNGWSECQGYVCTVYDPAGSGQNTVGCCGDQ